MLEHESWHSSSRQPQVIPSEGHTGRTPRQAANVVVILKQMLTMILPDFRTADALAFELARRTPLTIAICFTLLAAGVIGSRLDLWQENSLWGIPALGAISMGIGFWFWSVSLSQYPTLSQRARDALGRAIRLQWSMVAGGVVSLLYFLGMAIGLWH